MHASLSIDGAAPTRLETGHACGSESNPIGDDNDKKRFPFSNTEFDAEGGDSPGALPRTPNFTPCTQALGFDGTDGTLPDPALTSDLNAGGEDVAPDNLVPTGAVVPEPSGEEISGEVDEAARRRTPAWGGLLGAGCA